MSRRGNGEGSIFQRKDGRWAGQVTTGYLPNGRQRYKVVYGKSRREVAEKLNRLMVQSGSRVVSAPGKVTVAEWLTRFAREHGASKKPKTRLSYDYYLSKINPELGSIQLKRLTPAQVRAFYVKLAEDGLSLSVRRHIHHFLSRALRVAVRLDMAPSNPLEVVDIPEGEAGPVARVWQSKDIGKFLTSAKRDRLYAAFYLLLVLGLRIGELLALRWSDIEGEQLRVGRTLSHIGKSAVFGTPKSARSRRMLYLPPDVLSVLAEHRENQLLERDLAKHYEDHDLIFASTIGTPMRIDNFRRSHKRIVTRAGVPYIRVHDLRHTWLTLARDAGIDPEVVAERAGHDVRMTLGVYSQVTEQRKRKAALTLDQLLQS